MNPAATSQCEYCSLNTSDQLLASVGISWNTRWHNQGLGFAYVILNIAVAILLYYTFRVAKWDAISIKNGPSNAFAGSREMGDGLRTLLVGETDKGRKAEKEGRSERAY